MQHAIVLLSFGFSDLLATGSVSSIQFRSLRRGARRAAKLRSWGRAVQAVLNRAGGALMSVVDRVEARAAASYCRTKHVVSAVLGRIHQFFAVLAMFAAMYSLLLPWRLVSRKKRVAVAVTVAAPIQETTIPACEPSLLMDEPAPALACAVPMPSTARMTKPDDDKARLVSKAKELLAEGRSRRGVAKELGLAESTLRRWLA